SSAVHENITRRTVVTQRIEAETLVLRVPWVSMCRSKGLRAVLFIALAAGCGGRLGAAANDALDTGAAGSSMPPSPPSQEGGLESDGGPLGLDGDSGIPSWCRNPGPRMARDDIGLRPCIGAFMIPDNEVVADDGCRDIPRAQCTARKEYLDPPLSLCHCNGQ